LEQGLKSNCLKVNEGPYSLGRTASLWSFHYFNKMKQLQENTLRETKNVLQTKP